MRIPILIIGFKGLICLRPLPESLINPNPGFKFQSMVVLVSEMPPLVSLHNDI